MGRKKKTKADYEELPFRLGNSRRLQVDGVVKKMAPGRLDEWRWDQYGRSIKGLEYFNLLHQVWGRIERITPVLHVVYIFKDEVTWGRRECWVKLKNGKMVEWSKKAISWKEYRETQYR